MAATRWDPFRELLTLQERLDKMYRDMERTRKEEDFVSSEWRPPVDIFESRDIFVLKLEILKWIRRASTSRSMTTS